MAAIILESIIHEVLCPKGHLAIESSYKDRGDFFCSSCVEWYKESEIEEFTEAETSE